MQQQCRRSGKRKQKMKLSLPPKLVEKLVRVSVMSFCKIFIPSYEFDALLCRNQPFSPPDRLTLRITLTNLGLTPRNMPLGDRFFQATNHKVCQTIDCLPEFCAGFPYQFPLVLQNQQPGGTARHGTFSSTHNIGWLLVLKYNRFCINLHGVK